MLICSDISENKTLPKSAAIGQFDGLHLGHRALINSSVRLAESFKLIPTIITFSQHKDESLIFTFAQKSKIIKTLGINNIYNIDFDSIKSLSGEEFVVLLKESNFKLIACGFDFSCGKNRQCSALQLKEICQKYDIICHIQNGEFYNKIKLSSTNLRATLKAGDVQIFKHQTGQFYNLCGEVVEGKQLGRTLGAPTANIVPAKVQCLPRFGVYASLTTVDGVTHKSVTNIGIKPTFLSEPLCETFIFDFCENIYNKNIEVSFVKFLREEVKFETKEQLNDAIKKDKILAQKALKEY